MRLNKADTSKYPIALPSISPLVAYDHAFPRTLCDAVVAECESADAKPSTVYGQPVTGVEAPMPASAKLPASARNVLYATDNSLHRPVVLEVLDAGSYKYLMSFSQWGETVHLTAPANSIPASDTAPGPSLT